MWLPFQDDDADPSDWTNHMSRIVELDGSNVDEAIDQYMLNEFAPKFYHVFEDSIKAYENNPHRQRIFQ